MTEKIVFLVRDTVAPQIEVRRPGFDHEWQAFGKTSAADVPERLSGATIAITNKAPIRAECLAVLPDLKMIAVAATGTDNIDIDECRKRGIIVSNIRGYAVRTVPEHTFALILALRRSVVGFRQRVAEGAWQAARQFCFFDYPIGDLYGTRLGIFGGGSLGGAVAAIAGGFGMDVVFAGRKGADGAEKAGYAPFAEVIETADVLTLHCPLTAENRHMIGAAEFEAMKDTAILVNTARGALIDERALVDAIAGGRIGGAGIDVVDGEPPAADHPYMGLLDHPNFILTPHVGWASDQAMQILVDQLIDNIENFVAGRPSNVVGG